MSAKKIILVIICAMASTVAMAQLSYAEAQIRANRFFGYHEWASAAALYNYMLKENPKVPDTYGRAIVSNALTNDTIRSMDLLKEAMSYNIPLDSVLSQVQKYAFLTGHSSLYENFMLQAAHENPWMARPLDNYLLKYYSFRNDGAKMIQYADIMLAGAPDNVGFMLQRAKGYMLLGDHLTAVKIWRRITEIAPDNYDALLNLANYYAMMGQNDISLGYFERAQKIKSTPYVQKAITALE